ncbi:MAG: four helix bundle protein [Planctomycetia bacterium]|nr:four helix bundle protein [Planctomycetia bacterium]
MARTRSFEELIIWREARKLVPEIYRATRNFPDSEKYGLVSQLRRAAVSIPSNIAEGWARNTAADFNHFLGIALGSIAEQQTQLYLASDLDFLTASDARNLIDRGSLLRGLTLRFKSRLL